jgi:DNA-binding transcriptional MerR regulator
MSDGDKGLVNTEVWLTPAECASRTGLTVRALRVYERYGLLAAQRLPNGWRRYGSREMERLNTITVLKAMGMTLANIRKLIDEKNPSLSRVLEMQLDAWQAKKADAERGQALAKLAQRRVQAMQALSVDELCKLVRGFEMSDQLTMARELVDEHLTVEELAAFRARISSDPQGAADFKAHAEGQAAIFKQLRILMERGARPASPEVQQLLDERIALMTRYKLFERMLATIEWNRALALKFYALDAKIIKRMRNAPIPPNGADAVVRVDVMDFYIAATKESKYWKRMGALFREADTVMSVTVDPSSPEAQQLAAQFSAIHREFNFGDPKVYARIMPYTALLNGGWPDWMGGPEMEPIWNFLTSAMNCEAFSRTRVDSP